MPYGSPAAITASHSAEPVPGRHVDLEGQLAREADPAHPRRHAGDGRSRTVMNGNARRVDIQVRRQRAQHIARPWADDGHGRPLLGDRRQPHAQVRPLGLQPLLHPLQHFGGVAGGGLVRNRSVGQAQHDAVVEDHAVGAAHQRRSGSRPRPACRSVGVQAVQELGGVRPCTSILPRVEASMMRRRLRARRGTRAAPPRACPRRAAGSTTAASTGRRPRRPRRGPRASRGSASCAPGRTASPRSRPASSAKATGTYGGRGWSCRRRASGWPSSAGRDGRGMTSRSCPGRRRCRRGEALDVLDRAQAGVEATARCPRRWCRGAGRRSGAAIRSAGALTAIRADRLGQSPRPAAEPTTRWPEQRAVGHEASPGGRPGSAPRPRRPGGAGRSTGSKPPETPSTSHSTRSAGGRASIGATSTAASPPGAGLRADDGAPPGADRSRRVERPGDVTARRRCW